MDSPPVVFQALDDCMITLPWFSVDVLASHDEHNEISTLTPTEEIDSAVEAHKWPTIRTTEEGAAVVT